MSSDEIDELFKQAYNSFAEGLVDGVSNKEWFREGFYAAKEKFAPSPASINQKERDGEMDENDINPKPSWPTKKYTMTEKDSPAIQEGETAEEVGKDLIISGLEEGSEQWKAEYDNCRMLLEAVIESVTCDGIYGSRIENNKPVEVIEQAKEFLKEYQHQ